jgi:hypothetical protein
MEGEKKHENPEARITEPPPPDDRQLQLALARHDTLKSGATKLMPPTPDEEQLRRLLESR